ncbi:hypothetical protein GCM10010193_21720 [Kitasatospora atroaurantiaca]|uniref:Integral membrane protein n=1 Tax=Kitasatospora atroaurantiaca TaxID=285545 RepID=A0A561EV10_9ACTN|nr:hypothetical protein [Kitasatospora atroaurantiaca]TWE19437.1 hypothetical protein FB465_4554 [Kitasatospora atroaurantiaca]
MTAETIAQSPARPTPLLVGAVITALEGAALAGWGIYDMITGLLGDPVALGRSEAGGVVLLLMGLLPLLAGWSLLKLRRWGRSPAVLTNSICLPVAYYMWQPGGAVAVVAVVVALLGLAGIVSLLNPKVTQALYGDR